MYVLLRSCGNIDHGENPYSSVSPEELKKVSSLKEASRVCREYIDEWFLGGGNWFGGYVFESVHLDKQLAYISYNGRIWEPESEFFHKYKPKMD